MDQSIEPCWMHTFRLYCLKFFYIAYLILFYFFYKFCLVTSDPNHDFSTFQTIWIWSFRVANWLMLPAFVSLFVTIIFYHPPRPYSTKSSVDDQNNNSDVPKCKVANLIIRIVTVGNYLKMVEKSINYHTDLINRYLSYDYFCIHLVTEKPLNLQCNYPDTVTEIVVPVDYKTKSGSMGKVRNLAYWNESGQLGDLSDDKTWIIDLDEDVILSQSFMKTLTKKFLQDQTVAKIGVPQTIIKFNEKTSFINKLTQIYRFTIDLVLHWPNMVLLRNPPPVCHGGCYVARADCSMHLNAECGPYCCISDDNAYVLSMLSKGAKLEWIDGWFYEDAPTSLEASIRQRARWQRGHLYLLWYHPIAWYRKFGLFLFALGADLILPLNCVLRLTGFGLGLTEYWYRFFPAGLERAYFGDELAAAILASYIFALFYGCWYMLPWPLAVVYSLFTLTGIPLLILHVYDLAITVLTVFELVKETVRGKTTWNVTEKVEC